MTDVNILNVSDNLSENYQLLCAKRLELSEEIAKVDGLLGDISRISVNSCLGELENKYISITQNWFKDNSKFRIVIGKCYEIEGFHDKVNLALLDAVEVIYGTNEKVKHLSCNKGIKVYVFDVDELPFISLNELSKLEYRDLSKQAIESFVS
jgi:hypothetical protein